MSQVLFISDLHLGHKRICEFSGPQRGNSTTVEEHDSWIVEQWNSVVNKRDAVFVLGDVCFDMTKLPLLSTMQGNKILILGNHDKFDIPVYLKYFSKIHGLRKYKGSAWLSHSPIHPAELRGLPNIHGHVHHNTIPDNNYFNVCVEQLNGVPITWEQIQKQIKERNGR